MFIDIGWPLALNNLLRPNSELPVHPGRCLSAVQVLKLIRCDNQKTTFSVVGRRSCENADPMPKALFLVFLFLL